MSTTQAPAGRAPFWQATGLVAQREISTRIRSKAFVISTLIFFAAVLASVVIGGVGSSLFTSTSTVAVVADTEAQVSELPNTETVLVGSADEARELVAAGDADAAVVSGGSTDLLVIGDREEPGALVSGLASYPAIELLQPDAPNPMLTYFIGLGFGLVFFMAAMTFGSSIASSVVEEKQTRVVEILLAAVPARALLTGKVIGNSVLAFGQIAVTAMIVIVGGALTGQQLLLDGLAVPLLWFVALFTVGFVMIAALYAAAAALVSRVEDLGSVSSPIMMLVMIPYILVIIFNNNPAVLAVMSYVPFSAPVGMPMRLFLGTAAWWEPLASLGIMALTTAGILWFASRVYERSLLKTGKAVRWSEALRP